MKIYYQKYTYMSQLYIKNVRKGSMYNIKSYLWMKLSLVKSYDQMFHFSVP